MSKFCLNGPGLALAAACFCFLTLVIAPRPSGAMVPTQASVGQTQAAAAFSLYSSGQGEQAIEAMAPLVKKYPLAAELRAALAAMLWAQGQRGAAQSNWVAVVGIEPRYQNRAWGRAAGGDWPPGLLAAWEDLWASQGPASGVGNGN